MKFKTLLGLLAVGLSLSVSAQTWPAKPLRLVVPFPAGGATDILARALSQELSKKLGQSIVVDNKPGAGGTIGALAGAQAAPDGYTLLLTTSSTHSIGPAINPRIPYNAETDFTPIVYVASSPQVILVPLSSPAKNLREFIDHARKNPGRLNYASSGNGTISNLSTENFKAQSGTFLVHIPYRGTGLSIADLISGKVDVLFDSIVSGMPHVRDGKLRALAVTSPKRSALAPELPAVSEVLPGFESVTWFGVFGPRGLSPEIVARVNQAVNAALAEPELKERFARLGAETTGGTPQAFATVVRSESAKWKKVITERKITAD
ncbi:tripartite tricarboxylate transporter substrate binding protein [Rhodoferax sp. BAB1]|uniref:Bug family tripartite tricarboxylate transporter substrate binding protein n=1 Tax=Rhodoferax sp. BAB1 TaxID=2741720 RepID=UPI001576505A|nr:tripartite tricarboxylate transporter substrate binding protein [Rhodoferax sp. BAB1]QKO22590.1 tripartite tricarboxylate transporter substrate binding protein [Rhodoferax sp. BAB1]